MKKGRTQMLYQVEYKESVQVDGNLPSKAEWKILENFVAEQLPPVEGDVWKMILETNTPIQIARMFGQH